MMVAYVACDDFQHDLKNEKVHVHYLQLVKKTLSLGYLALTE